MYTSELFFFLNNYFIIIITYSSTTFVGCESFTPRFPAVFSVYQCVSLLVSSCFDLVTRVDRQDTVCGSRNLLKNLESDFTAPLYCGLISRRNFHTYN